MQHSTRRPLRHTDHLGLHILRGQAWLTRRCGAAAVLNEECSEECSEEELDHERYADLVQHQEAASVANVLPKPGAATPDI